MFINGVSFAGLLGEYLQPAWHDKLLQAVCSSAEAAGEQLQPLADIGNCGDPSRPEKRAKARLPAATTPAIAAQMDTVLLPAVESWSGI